MVNFLKNRIFIVLVSVVAVAIVSGGSFYYGHQIGYFKGVENPKTLIIKGVANLDEGKEQGVDFSVFWEAWKVIEDKYVKSGELKNQDLVYGAVSGLINSLGDQNSVFMPPSDAKRFSEDISGEFSGIGAEIGIRDNQLVIISPLKNSPAEKAGLRPKDKILKIDERSTDGITVNEAVKLIRGPKGKAVILTILRDDWEKPKEISITRDVIQIPTLDADFIPVDKNNSGKGNIAHFKLYNFYENAPFLFYQAAVKTAFQNPKGLILDLRNNPGGYLEAAVNLAGWFFDKGEIVVSEEFRLGKKQDFRANGNGFFKELPIVVLINEGSASASEILAGALRDNRGVKLVGKQSYGKGTVQELQSLRDGSVVKITVAHWLLPSGQVIEKNGLKPDYEVDLTEEDAESGRDPQLEKAIDILKAE